MTKTVPRNFDSSVSFSHDIREDKAGVRFEPIRPLGWTDETDGVSRSKIEQLKLNCIDAEVELFFASCLLYRIASSRLEAEL